MVDAPARFPLAEHPRLRAIEVFPMQEGGRRNLVLRDPADPNISPILLPVGAADILAMLDGQRTLPQLASALLLRGGTISESQLRSFDGTGRSRLSRGSAG